MEQQNKMCSRVCSCYVYWHKGAHTNWRSLFWSMALIPRQPHPETNLKVKFHAERGGESTMGGKVRYVSVSRGCSFLFPLSTLSLDGKRPKNPIDDDRKSAEGESERTKVKLYTTNRRYLGRSSEQRNRRRFSE